MTKRTRLSPQQISIRKQVGLHGTKQRLGLTPVKSSIKKLYNLKDFEIFVSNLPVKPSNNRVTFRAQQLALARVLMNSKGVFIQKMSDAAFAKIRQWGNVTQTAQLDMGRHRSGDLIQQELLDLSVPADKKRWDTLQPHITSGTIAGACADLKNPNPVGEGFIGNALNTSSTIRNTIFVVRYQVMNPKTRSGKKSVAQIMGLIAARKATARDGEPVVYLDLACGRGGHLKPMLRALEQYALKDNRRYINLSAVPEAVKSWSNSGFTQNHLNYINDGVFFDHHDLAPMRKALTSPTFPNNAQRPAKRPSPNIAQRPAMSWFNPMRWFR